MQKNVKKTTVVCLFFIIGIQLYPTEDDSISYIRYTKEIINPFIEEWEKKYHLNCFGTGVRFSHNVEQMHIKFMAYQRGTIEKARILEVGMTEDLLSRINTHEKIRPFLNTYPFDVKDIKISISFRKEDDSCYTDGSVVYVSHIKNYLSYDKEDPKTGQLVEIMKEPYEEALKIVKSQAPQIKEIPLPVPKI
jgi:hypothetical protein